MDVALNIVYLQCRYLAVELADESDRQDLGQ